MQDIFAMFFLVLGTATIPARMVYAWWTEEIGDRTRALIRDLKKELADTVLLNSTVVGTAYESGIEVVALPARYVPLWKRLLSERPSNQARSPT